MGMVVRSNIMALNANRQLGMNSSSVTKSLEKLSSGFKINRAGDDASGLAISEKMKAQIKGLETASANSQDGISLIQTAEGALTEVHSMLNRMTELATKSSNGTIKDDVDRAAIQKEVDALNEEVDRISQSTNFNGINLLDGTMGGGGGTASASGIKVGSITDGFNAVMSNNAAVGEVAAMADTAAGVTALGGKASFTLTYKDNKGMETTVKVDLDFAAKGGGYDVNTTNAAIIEKLEEAGVDKLFKIETDGAALTFTALGKYTVSGVAADGVLATPIANTDLTVTAATPANTVMDLGAGNAFAAGDFVNVNGKIYEFVAADGDKTKQNGATAITVGADLEGSVDNLAKALGKNGINATLNGTEITFTKKEGATSVAGDGLTLQVGDTNDDFNKVSVYVEDMSAGGLGTRGLDVSNQTAAGDAIQTIKDAINKVSTNRATLGALQNRLEYTINNLDVSAENMTAANSRIRDTDMAKQMMDYTKMNVLNQAAQAMLAQANQQPQSILQLLQ